MKSSEQMMHCSSLSSTSVICVTTSAFWALAFSFSSCHKTAQHHSSVLDSSIHCLSSPGSIKYTREGGGILHHMASCFSVPLTLLVHTGTVCRHMPVGMSGEFTFYVVLNAVDVETHTVSMSDGSIAARVEHF